MALKKGDNAPYFEVVSTDKETISLSSYDNQNLLLLFFPLAFTGVCTTELCSMRDSIADYNNVNAQILAVSVDSPMVLGKFKEEQGLNFTLASDFNAEACKAYGSMYKEFVLGMKNVAKRSAFVIDGNGTIQYAEVLESAGDLPNFENVMAALKSIA